MIVAVLGVGLIGGSIGLAARERLGAEVRGFDLAPGAGEAALARGAVTSACATPAEALAGAEAAFVAAPVGALPGAVRAAWATSTLASTCGRWDTDAIRRSWVSASRACGRAPRPTSTCQSRS